MEQRGSGCVSMNDFYPFDTMLVWVVGMAQCLCLSVGLLFKLLDGSSWFFTQRLLLTYPTLCVGL